MGEHTDAVHLPIEAAPRQQPLGLPVYRSAAFSFGTSEEYSALLTGTLDGYVYGRHANPTAMAFARALAEMEGAGVGRDVAGEPFGSGMAAIATTVLAHCRPGSRVVASRQLYGGTYEFLRTLGELSIATEFVDFRDESALRAALAEPAALVWAETLANPTMSVANLPLLAELAHRAGALLGVDSTFASPAVCQPLAHGADLVMHSATKYVGGHSDAMGGFVCGAPELVAPIHHWRTQLGGVLAPDDAFLLHRGLATLPLRMARHCSNALAFAQAMAAHPGVEVVEYPGLPQHPDHELAGRLFKRGRYGGVVAIVLPGGREAAACFCDRLRIAKVASSLGGIHTVVSPIATTTHRQLDDRALGAAGFDPGAVRISVGLEDVEDVIADALQSLESMRR